MLTPLSCAYAGIIRGRNSYYDRVSSAVARAAIPVISVGNLTVGGTGKTPLVIEIVRRLVRLGRRPAVLTRGYKGQPGRPADEVREFHEAVPDIPVVVNRDRVAGAVAAQQVHGADCVVLDDGFQHRHLARDLDIVLIDALRPWGGGWLLPAGELREPLRSLARADLCVITRANQVPADALARLEAKLRPLVGGRPIVQCAVEAEEVVRRGGEREPATLLAGQPVLAVCGLGNPRTFEQLVTSVVQQPVTSLSYRDHYPYRPADAAAIASAARRARATWVVTTRKDWVKLAPVWPDDAAELLRLDMRVVLLSGAEEFATSLRWAVERRA